MKRYEGRFGPAMGQNLQKTVEKKDPHRVLPQPDGNRRELEAVMKRSVYLSTLRRPTSSSNPQDQHQVIAFSDTHLPQRTKSRVLIPQMLVRMWAARTLIHYHYTCTVCNHLGRTLTASSKAKHAFQRLEKLCSWYLRRGTEISVYIATWMFKAYSSLIPHIWITQVSFGRQMGN